MGSSHLLRTHNATIEADANGHPLIRFSLKVRIESAQEPLNEAQEESLDQVQQRRDSIYSYNERGCDEIMCQFVSDLDTTCEITIDV
jgi:hypothetical protein